MATKPKNFTLFAAKDLQPKDKIWHTWDGVRTIRSIEITNGNLLRITMHNGKVRLLSPDDSVWAFRPTGNEAEERLNAAVAAVEAYAEKNGFGWRNYGPDVEPNYADGRTLLSFVRNRNQWHSEDEPLSDDFTTADLERAANRGLIVMRKKKAVAWSERVHKEFTSLAKEAEAAAERALSDQERIDRLMADFVPRYEQRRSERGDNPRTWPLDLSRFGDGVRPAVDAGILFEANNGYVPGSHYEAYVEAVETYNAREEKAREHHHEVTNRILSLAGPSNGGRTLSLSTQQAERLLELLEGSGGH